MSGTGISNVNPFRYRGYYYDTETKLYYLLNRYYDPEIGRFVNADQLSYLSPETLNGCNLLAYCNNNPVMGYDPLGSIAISLLVSLIVIGVGIVAGAIAGTVKAVNDEAKGWEFVADILMGIGIGVALAGSVLLLGGITATFLGGGIVSYSNSSAWCYCV